VTLDAGGPIVVRRPTDGRVLGTLSDYRTLTGQDLTTESVGDAAVAAVDQDGERVVLALPAAVPYQDPVSGAMTTGGLATVTVRDRPSRADARPVPAAPSLRAGPASRPVCAGVWRDAGASATLVLARRIALALWGGATPG